ncbi:MAG: crossover junction endodeoxyribonuclease RuvC [Patescibacteria group bacterium]
MIRILGVDPGTARIGWGIITQDKGKLTADAYGCITTPQHETAETRLKLLFQECTKIIKAHKPDVVSVEDLFFATNAKTAIAVGQARGVILLAASLSSLPVASYSPVTIKNTICGSGTATKAQIGKMVQILFSLKSIPTPDDTCDALAIAATHGFSYKLKTQMQNAYKSAKLR